MTPAKWEARVRGKTPTTWREVMPTKTEPTVEARVEYLKTIKSWDGEPVYEFRALYEEPPAVVPQGWKLVPVEPTPGMCAAWPANHHGSGHEAAIYRAMLAAAPAAPAPCAGA